MDNKNIRINMDNMDNTDARCNISKLFPHVPKRVNMPTFKTLRNVSFEESINYLVINKSTK